MAYIDGFLIPVPSENKQQFVKYANTTDTLVKELGATRVLECWGDDLPDGTHTDFRKAVAANEDETVVFAWVEWPDKETRDAATKRMHEVIDDDPRFDPEKNPVPFDGARIVFGGFEPVVEL